MKDLLKAGRLLLLDMASTVFFLILYSLTKNLTLAIALGMTLGIGQIVWEVAHRKPIDTMQWVSLIVILASGTASLVSRDPRFMMVKPTVIYAAVGIVMLKRGWIDRYQPQVVHDLMPDIVIIFGYVWSGLMFVSAAVNLIAAFTLSIAAWAAFISIFGLVSKLSLFLAQYAITRFVGVRRVHALEKAGALTPGMQSAIS